MRADPVDSFITASQFQRAEALAQLRPEADLAPVMARRREIFAEGRGDHLSNCTRYEMQTYLVDLLVRQDKMTMAHSLENRVPFLDRDLVAFARQAPAHSLVSPQFARRRARMRGTKVMLKNLARRSFDDRFVYRDKSGFSLPLADYMADRRFAALMEDRLLPGMRTRGLVDADAGASSMAGPGRARTRRGRVGLDRRRLRVVGPAIPRLDRGACLEGGVSAGHPARPVRPLRIVFCWAEVTGYMAACWQELARRPGIDLHILHTEQLTEQEPPFHLGPLLSGLSHQPFAKDIANVDSWLLEQVASRRPDVVVICGWIFWPYTRLMSAKVLEPAAMVLGMDSPWRGTAAQRLARLRLRQIVRHTDLVITASERSATYAQQHGHSRAAHSHRLLRL